MQARAGWAPNPCTLPRARLRVSPPTHGKAKTRTATPRTTSLNRVEYSSSLSLSLTCMSPSFRMRRHTAASSVVPNTACKSSALASTPRDTLAKTAVVCSTSSKSVSLMVVGGRCGRWGGGWWAARCTRKASPALPLVAHPPGRHRPAPHQPCRVSRRQPPPLSMPAARPACRSQPHPSLHCHSHAGPPVGDLVLVARHLEPLALLAEADDRNVGEPLLACGGGEGRRRGRGEGRRGGGGRELLLARAPIGCLTARDMAAPGRASGG